MLTPPLDVLTVPLGDAGTALRPLTRRWPRLGVAACLWALVSFGGCSAESSSAPGQPSGTADAIVLADAAKPLDSGADGAGALDADAQGVDALADSTPPDSAPPDSTPTDATPADSAPPDATPADSTAPDADVADAEPADAGPGLDSASTADTEPELPAPSADPAILGPAVPAQIELLWGQQPSFAAPGQGSVVMAQAGTETALLDIAGLPPQFLQGDPGPARSLAVMPGPQYLLATDKGLYGLQGKKWGISPVQALIGAAPQWLLVQGGSGGPWLWLGQTQAAGQVAALWRHDGQLLQPVAVPELDLAAALVQGAHWSDGPAIGLSAAGLPQSGGQPKPALWLVAAGSLRALVTNGKSANVWPDQPLPPGKRLASDASGRLWWLASDGTLHQRDPGGDWQWLALPEGVTEMAGRPDVPFSVVQTAQGLWLQQQGVFFAVQGTAGLQLRGLSATGGIIAVGKQGLVRVTPGQPTPPPPPSWAKDVLPLHNARCGTCHGPSAVTVKLHTAALWQQWFGKIQKQLATDAMPLVGTKLSAADKALIKAWGAGGYQP